MTQSTRPRGLLAHNIREHSHLPACACLDLAQLDIKHLVQHSTAQHSRGWSSMEQHGEENTAQQAIAGTVQASTQQLQHVAIYVFNARATPTTVQMEATWAGPTSDGCLMKAA